MNKTTKIAKVETMKQTMKLIAGMGRGLDNDFKHIAGRVTLENLILMREPIDETDFAESIIGCGVACSKSRGSKSEDSFYVLVPV